MFNNKAIKFKPVSGCYFVGQQLSFENKRFYKQVMAFFSLPPISCSNTLLYLKTYSNCNDIAVNLFFVKINTKKKNHPSQI